MEVDTLNAALSQLYTVAQLQQVARSLKLSGTVAAPEPSCEQRRVWTEHIRDLCLEADDPVTACKLGLVYAKHQRDQADIARVHDWWACLGSEEGEIEAIPDWSWAGDKMFTRRFRFVVADLMVHQTIEDLCSADALQHEENNIFGALQAAVQKACLQNAAACNRLLRLDLAGREQAAAELVQLLLDPQLRSARQALVLGSQSSSPLFASVWEDMPLRECLWKLIGSHVVSTLDTMQFTRDRFGLQTCIACLKDCTEFTAPLEASVSSLMHGAEDRICFEAAAQSDANKAELAERTLVVVFSSMGSGLVRHEFGGSLRVVCPHADRLYVLDPCYSWYLQGPGCTWDGVPFYEDKLNSYINSGQYERVVMVGDSMGGSGALLFSHLASHVISFSPQVELVGYPMLTREDLTILMQQNFTQLLLKNVDQCLQQGGRIAVHVGDYQQDIATLRSLPTACSRTMAEHDVTDDQTVGLHVIIHPYKDHLVTKHLKTEGKLMPLLRRAIIIGN